MKHLSSSDRIYLKHKHAGGRNNAKGNRYESFYAVSVIAKLLNKYRDDLSLVSLHAQVPYTFVDDLLLIEPSMKTYHQIKDVKGLTWNTGHSKSLEYDYRGQKRLCRAKKEPFRLKIVHSHSKDTMSPIPKGLGRCTIIEVFPAETDMNALVITSVDFQDNLRRLLYNGNALPLDRITDFATWILGIWDASSQNDPISLDTLEKKISMNFPEYIGNISVTLTPEFETMFKTIGVEYSTCGTCINISYSNLKASFVWNDETKASILANKPKSPIELFKLAL